MDTGTTKWIPVPYFQISQEVTILNSSHITHSYFYTTSNIWNIIHKEDRNKAIVMLSQNANSDSITKHLILQTWNKLFGNFKSTIQWKDGIGHLFSNIYLSITQLKKELLSLNLKSFVMSPLNI